MALNVKYLDDADTLLRNGDYVQASEKLWGAVAEIVKAVAETRGWRQSSHRELRSTVERLFNETEDRDLLLLFSVAESLHANFYENFMSDEVVTTHAEDARRLVSKLQNFAA
jgi:uncharacterized protein (UPF0332 family)